MMFKSLKKHQTIQFHKKIKKAINRLLAFILSDVSYSSCNGAPARACSLSPLNPQRRSKEQVPNSVLFVLMPLPITATMGSERTANRLQIAIFYQLNS